MTDQVGKLKTLWRWLAQPKQKRDPIEDLELLKDPSSVQAVSALLVTDLIRERRSERRWIWVRRGMWVGGGLLLVAYYLLYMSAFNGWKIDTTGGDYAAVVRVKGEIMGTTLASSEKIVPALRAAFEDKDAKFVILAIDSPGGSPIESERINYMISTLKKKHDKPVYAVIETVGASAAYMIAMQTDRIYAGKYSLVGSIGAVISAWDVHKALERFEVTQKVYASGELKSMLSPFSAPTPAAEAKAQALVDRAGGLFVQEMKLKRGERLKADVRYDTGEIWDGEQAEAIGLVDEIATIEKVAEDRKVKLREYGPGVKTISPLGASSELASSFLVDVAVKVSRKLGVGMSTAEMGVR